MFPTRRVPVAPGVRVRQRDDDDMAGAGSYLLVAARADVRLVCLVRLDSANLRGAGSHWIVHERVLDSACPACSSAAHAAGATVLAGGGTPRCVFLERVPVSGPSGHATDYVAHRSALLACPDSGPCSFSPVITGVTAAASSSPTRARGRVLWRFRSDSSRPRSGSRL